MRSAVPPHRHLHGLARVLLLLALTAGLAAYAAPAAAAPPVHDDHVFSATVVFADYCSFPINITFDQTGHQTLFFHANGNLARIVAHVVEVDTFSANGIVLRSDPFPVNFDLRFDRDGNLTHYVAHGLVMKLPLPDGSTFVTAGKVNWLNHLDDAFVVEPDWGTPADQARFCAALTP